VYETPYEKELGQYPSLDDMQDLVVNKNQRPIIKQSWLKQNVSLNIYIILTNTTFILQGMALVVKTIEECWDIHVEARLSSECAASRLRKIINIEYKS
jgi:hypothetical protein